MCEPVQSVAVQCHDLVEDVVVWARGVGGKERDHSGAVVDDCDDPVLVGMREIEVLERAEASRVVVVRDDVTCPRVVGEGDSQRFSCCSEVC